jgi:hypothetical protein
MLNSEEIVAGDFTSVPVPSERQKHKKRQKAVNCEYLGKKKKQVSLFCARFFVILQASINKLSNN